MAEEAARRAHASVAEPTEPTLEHRPPRPAARAPDGDAAAGRVSGGIAGVRDLTTADDLANLERGRPSMPAGEVYFLAHGGAAFAAAGAAAFAAGAGGAAPPSDFEPATSLLAS